jgi:hypothetical protein
VQILIEELWGNKSNCWEWHCEKITVTIRKCRLKIRGVRGQSMVDKICGLGTSFG